MKSGLTILVVVCLVLITVVVARCGGGSPKEPAKMAVDSSMPIGPAPDNNSANNPSLADTAYEKDRTRPITDTMKNK